MWRLMKDNLAYTYGSKKLKNKHSNGVLIICTSLEHTGFNSRNEITYLTCIVIGNDLKRIKLSERHKIGNDLKRIKHSERHT